MGTHTDAPHTALATAAGGPIVSLPPTCPQLWGELSVWAAAGGVSE